MKWFSLGQFRDSWMVFRCPTAQHNYTRCSRKGGCWQPCHGGDCADKTPLHVATHRAGERCAERAGVMEIMRTGLVLFTRKKGGLLSLLTNVINVPSFQALLSRWCSFSCGSWYKKSSTHPGSVVQPNFKDLGHLIRWRNIWKHGEDERYNFKTPKKTHQSPVELYWSYHWRWRKSTLKDRC